MKNRLKTPLLAALSLLAVTSDTNAGEGMTQGTPQFASMSSLEFSPEGVLFIGDSIKGSVVAIDLAERKAAAVKKPPAIPDLEGKIAALVGAKAADVLIHDMAVNPVSKKVYLTVSRGRANWNSRWSRPNNVANASILVRVNLDSSIEAVDLSDVKYASANLPNPIDDKKDAEKGASKSKSKRVDAITQMTYRDGKLYVAGLSNEEFASSMWTFSYPFKQSAKATTVEIFHGAHNQYETHSPIRAFLPYDLNNKGHLLAAYLCTPLVSFPIDALTDKTHVKGRTIAELGSGNIPIDMIAYQHQGEERILMSNTQLPLMSFKAKDVESFKGNITKKVEGFVAGVKYEAKSGNGVQQIDNFNDDYVITTKRTAAGKLALSSMRKSWI